MAVQMMICFMTIHSCLQDLCTQDLFQNDADAQNVSVLAKADTATPTSNRFNEPVRRGFGQQGISLTVSSLVSTVAVNQWFDKRRGLANGVMISGISIATMLLPILVRACIDHYGVRGALLIYSAVLLHISCGGLLLLPAQTEKEETCLDRSKTADEPVVMANGTFTDQCSKCLSMDELSAQQCTCHSVAFGYKLHNTTVHEIPNGSLPPKSQSAMIFIPTEPSFQHDNEKDTDKRLLHSSVGSLRRQHLRKKIGNHAISAQSLPNVDIASGNILKHFRPNWKIWSTSKLSEDHLQNTTKYEKNVQRTDLSFVVVLKRCDIMAYIFSINVAVIGLRNAFMFIPAYAEDWGISKLTTVYILVVMGIMDFVGSIATGVIADTAWVRTRYLLAGYLVVLGIVVILTSFFKGITSLIITSVTIGIFGGAFVGLFTACLREVAGDDHFPRAVSIHYFIQGVMFLPMPSLLGLTRDLAGSSENIFRICGAIMLLSSGMIACGAYRAYRRR